MKFGNEAKKTTSRLFLTNAQIALAIILVGPIVAGKYDARLITFGLILLGIGATLSILFSMMVEEDE